MASNNKSATRADDINERIVRLIRASTEELVAIDRILAGEVEPRIAPANGPLLLGMKPAAQLLGVSRATLWRMIRAGKLARVEVLPGSFRVRRLDVEALAN